MGKQLNSSPAHFFGNEIVEEKLVQKCIGRGWPYEFPQQCPKIIPTESIFMELRENYPLLPLLNKTTENKKLGRLVHSRILRSIPNLL